SLLGLAGALWYQGAEAALNIQAEKQKLAQLKEQHAKIDAELEKTKEDVRNERRQLHQMRYGRDIHLAQRFLDMGNVRDALGLLTGLEAEPGQEDLRGFEWYYLWQLYRRDRSTLSGHTKGVAAVAYSYDGRYIASAAADHTVKVWDAATGQLSCAFKEHTSPVS